MGDSKEITHTFGHNVGQLLVYSGASQTTKLFEIMCLECRSEARRTEKTLERGRVAQRFMGNTSKMAAVLIGRAAESLPVKIVSEISSLTTENCYFRVNV